MQALFKEVRTFKRPEENHTHRKAVICEDGFVCLLFKKFVFALQYMVHKVQRERRHDGEKIFQVQVSRVSEFGGEDVHEHFVVLGAFRKVAYEVVDGCIQISIGIIAEEMIALTGKEKTSKTAKEKAPCSVLSVRGELFLLCKRMKGHNVLQIRHKLNGITSEVETSTSYHSYITHCVAFSENEINIRRSKE